MDAAHPWSHGTTPAAPGVEYHRVLAGPRRRIGRGLLAIALLVGGMTSAALAFAAVASWMEGLLRPGETVEQTMNSHGLSCRVRSR